jgi:hypothetical protein
MLSRVASARQEQLRVRDLDELEASGGSRSQAVRLLHSWKPVAKY